MFRKITMAVVPAAALALMLCASDNFASQAFARGGRGGHGVHNGRNHRGFNHRSYGRYGWGYPSYYGYGYPTCGYSAVCEPQFPVVAEAVAPVCSTCEPIFSGSYPSSWGYGHYGHYRHFNRGRGMHGSRGMHGGRGRR